MFSTIHIQIIQYNGSYDFFSDGGGLPKGSRMRESLSMNTKPILQLYPCCDGSRAVARIDNVHAHSAVTLGSGNDRCPADVRGSAYRPPAGGELRFVVISDARDRCPYRVRDRRTYLSGLWI